ncbi:hypothetical protein JMA_36230 [Jeotgalibacillus malaysiensis]|uniref:Uncharacterized protein n=1 Tax=Jeotgalibacillus malaysiensis TaxID=1508404 RepID=A0A0B5ARP8_9BACL|nr:hypothetical protein [Jeotgalibacillus malaysiensis]AJD92940.1 hypothetical protein JMA_36230 [Jeotgalibacillus malaysiensis]
MDLLLWFTIAFFVIGLIILLVVSKKMRNRVRFLKSNPDVEDGEKQAKPVIWFIWAAVAWGVVSMALVVTWFSGSA